MPAKSRSKGGNRKKGTKTTAGGGLAGRAVSAARSLAGMKGKGGGGGGKRRSRGPAYWANRVIVERLKQKYRRLKFGSVR